MPHFFFSDCIHRTVHVPRYVQYVASSSSVHFYLLAIQWWISILQSHPRPLKSHQHSSKESHPHMDLDMTCDRGVQLTPSQASMHLHGPPPSSHVMVRLKSSSGGSARVPRRSLVFVLRSTNTWGYLMRVSATVCFRIWFYVIHVLHNID